MEKHRFSYARAVLRRILMLLPLARAASIAAYYEGIGVLVKRGLIDIDLVYDLLHTGIKITWEKMSPEFFESRAREGGHPRLWSTFEYFYNEIIKREQHPEIEA